MRDLYCPRIIIISRVNASLRESIFMLCMWGPQHNPLNPFRLVPVVVNSISALFCEDWKVQVQTMMLIGSFQQKPFYRKLHLSVIEERNDMTLFKTLTLGRLLFAKWIAFPTTTAAIRDRCCRKPLKTCHQNSWPHLSTTAHGSSWLPGWTTEGWKWLFTKCSQFEWIPSLILHLNDRILDQ